MDGLNRTSTRARWRCWNKQPSTLLSNLGCSAWLGDTGGTGDVSLYGRTSLVACGSLGEREFFTLKFHNMSYAIFWNSYVHMSRSNARCTAVISCQMYWWILVSRKNIQLQVIDADPSSADDVKYTLSNQLQEIQKNHKGSSLQGLVIPLLFPCWSYTSRSVKPRNQQQIFQVQMDLMDQSRSQHQAR